MYKYSAPRNLHRETEYTIRKEFCAAEGNHQIISDFTSESSAASERLNICSTKKVAHGTDVVNTDFNGLYRRKYIMLYKNKMYSLVIWYTGI